jgi:hypothetical protein
MTTNAPLRQEFDQMAAGMVYMGAGTLVMNGLSPNVDATIKNSSALTNLNAMAAGYPAITPFVDAVIKYPELTAAADKMLKDEGQNIIGPFQEMLAGQNPVDMQQLAGLMDNPEYRGKMAEMMNKVGTQAVGADYAVRFSQAMVSSAKDPSNKEKAETFAKVSAEYSQKQPDQKQATQEELAERPEEQASKGLPSPQKPDASSAAKKPQMLSSLFGEDGFLKNILSMEGLRRIMDKVGFSPEITNGILGVVGSIISLVKESFGSLIYGDRNQPGLASVGERAWEMAKDKGRTVGQPKKDNPPAPQKRADAAPVAETKTADASSSSMNGRMETAFNYAAPGKPSNDIGETPSFEAPANGRTNVASLSGAYTNPAEGIAPEAATPTQAPAPAPKKGLALDAA